MPTSRAYSSCAASDDATEFSYWNQNQLKISFVCVCGYVYLRVGVAVNLPIRDQYSDV